MIECIPSSERLHTSSQHHTQNKPTNQILLVEQNKYQCPIKYKESFTSPSLNLPSVSSTVYRIEIPIRAGEIYQKDLRTCKYKVISSGSLKDLVWWSPCNPRTGWQISLALQPASLVKLVNTRPMKDPVSKQNKTNKQNSACGDFQSPYPPTHVYMCAYKPTHTCIPKHTHTHNTHKLFFLRERQRVRWVSQAGPEDIQRMTLNF